MSGTVDLVSLRTNPLVWFTGILKGPDLFIMYLKPAIILPNIFPISAFRVRSCVEKYFVIARWSCNPWPTSGEWWINFTSDFFNISFGPTPDNWSIWGEPIAPADKMISLFASAYFLILFTL